MKYNEDKFLDELKKYVEGTYGEHYCDDKTGIQLGDWLISSGRAEDFFIGSIHKYVGRYGKKDGYNKKDLFKAMHYLLMLMNLKHTPEA